MEPLPFFILEARIRFCRLPLQATKRLAHPRHRLPSSQTPSPLRSFLYPEQAYPRLMFHTPPLCRTSPQPRVHRVSGKRIVVCKTALALRYSQVLPRHLCPRLLPPRRRPCHILQGLVSSRHVPHPLFHGLLCRLPRLRTTAYRAPIAGQQLSLPNAKSST